MASSNANDPTPALAFPQWSDTMDDARKFEQIFMELEPSMVKPVYSEKLHKIKEAIKLLKESIPEFPELKLSPISDTVSQPDLNCSEEMEPIPLSAGLTKKGSSDSIVSFGCRSEPSDSSEPSNSPDEDTTVSLNSMII
jgi:hypothetical protein